MAMLAGCGRAEPRATAGSAEKTHISIGIAVPGATYLPIYLAVDDGLYAAQGLATELLEFRGGSDVIKALVAGSIDVGVVGLAEVTAGIDRTNRELYAFEAMLSSASGERYQIERRHQELVEYYEHFKKTGKIKGD